jgi:hypothetical protein
MPEEIIHREKHNTYNACLEKSRIRGRGVQFLKFIGLEIWKQQLKSPASFSARF